MWGGSPSSSSVVANAAPAGPKMKVEHDDLVVGENGHQIHGAQADEQRKRTAAKSRLEAYRAQKAAGGGNGVVVSRGGVGGTIDPTKDWQFASSPGSTHEEGGDGDSSTSSGVGGVVGLFFGKLSAGRNSIALVLGVLMLLLSGVLLTDTALIREHVSFETVTVLAPPPGEEEASQAVEAYIHMKEEAHTGEVEHVNSWQVETHTKDEIELFGVGPNGEVEDETAVAEGEQKNQKQQQTKGVAAESSTDGEEEGGGGEGGDGVAAAAAAAGDGTDTSGSGSQENNEGEGAAAGAAAAGAATAGGGDGDGDDVLPASKRWCVPSMCKRGCPEVCKSFVRSSMNEASLLPLRNVHANQTGILLGTGASLDKYVHSDYDNEGKPVVTASIKSIIYTNIPVDYVIFSDRAGPKGYDKNFRKIDAYRPRRGKFYLHFASQKTFAPGSNPKWVKRGAAKAVEAKAASLGTFPLVSDVGHYQMGSSRSSIFMALQLLLYTGVKKVYVVGCDSSLLSGYAKKSGGAKFPGREKPTEVRKIKEAWAEAVKQVPILFPGVELILVNPVGLSGLKGVQKMNTGKRQRPLFTPPPGTPAPAPWGQPPAPA